MDRPFDAGEFERQFALLQNLPPTLYAPTVTHPDGSLVTRVRGLLGWRKALLRGRLPTMKEVDWPSEAIRQALLRELERLNIARFCRDQPELTDALLSDILRAVETYALEIGQKTGDLLAELQRLEQLRREQARKAEEARRRQEARRGTVRAKGGSGDESLPEGSGGAGGGGPEAPGGGAEPEEGLPALDSETLARLKEEAKRLAGEQVAADAAEAFHNAWEERARLWADLADVFGELGDLLGRGWDFCLGILKSVGWLEVVRLQKLLERVPALREVVRSLGRLHANPDHPEELPVAERIFRDVRRAEEERHMIMSPFAPVETRGVTRSDDIMRMLPSEAAMLGHPVLRKLWHARRAEHTLATYRVEGVLVDHAILEERDMQEEVEAPPPPKIERGPILVCVDTSGSMHGTPETVAKAIALEAVRVAHAEKRGCHLYLFSGPGQVVEHTLKLTPEGLADLLAFLTSSFHGGTDVAEPLRRAAERLGKEEWARADILLLSDGEFPVPGETVAILRGAREKHELRVHGVLIGSSRREAMEGLCDHIHRFLDWQGFLEGGDQHA